MLTKEESAANLAREAGIGEPTLYHWREQFIEVGRAGLADGKNHPPQRRKLDRVKAQLAERDQVIGELTVANRIFKKVGQLKVDETLNSMVQGELLADRDIRLTQVLGALGI